MGFEKTQPAYAQKRTKFDVDNQADLAEIRYFEKELAPFLKSSIVIFGKELKGFELYLHKNNMLRYSPKYPQGAVVFENLESYKTSEMKYRALTALWDRKRKAEEKETERVQALIPQMA